MTGMLVALFTLTGGAPAEPAATDAARYGWLSSLEEGQREARETGKPLLVVLRCEA